MSIIETYNPQRPRILLFHFLIGGMVLVLGAGLAYRQLFRSGDYGERERLQNQRRVLVPGPRGNIYDREGRLLVGNRSRFAVTLYLDELRGAFRTEYIEIVRRYRASEAEQVDMRGLNRHFQQQLLLPYILLDDLKPEEYARLIERLPVASPLQVYTSSTRYYPYHTAAAHALGYVGGSDEISLEDVPGEDLKTYAFKSTIGRDGLELRYDARLQGETGGTIYRVDPAGFRVNPPLNRKMPVQGHNLAASLDIDLQLAAERAMEQFESLKGAAVALDVRTGEVLVLASLPDYDLNAFSPRLSPAAAQDINERGAWTNRAIGGVYPPGSTFKLITTLAGLRSGRLSAENSTADCRGTLRIGGRNFVCDKSSRGYETHGIIGLRDAIAKSCDIFFYTYGMQIGPDLMAAEARRFHLDRRTGIDLPNETSRMLIPDTAWKQKTHGEGWFAGDSANMAIGQGFIGVTPLGMACFVASLARGETTTVPILLHQPDRPPQHTAPIGLTPGQYATILSGMEGCTTEGTAKILTTAFLRIPGLRIAGKTGTSQVGPAGAQTNIAWFVCFAPVDDPRIAVAVAIEGDQPGETFGGGRYAAPVAQAILKAWFEKQQRPSPAVAGVP